MPQKPRSIEREVNLSSRLLTAVLLCPAVLSLIVMLFYAAVYSDSTSRMETVASLKPLVNTTIPEAVWSVVAGRDSFDECGAYDTIAQVNATLDGVIDKSADDSRLELTIARRTMDTLAEYVRKIEQDMAGGVPVVTSEQTLEEVRSVAALIDNMLEEYIAQEVEIASATNTRLARTTLIAAAIELAVLGLAIGIARAMRNRLSRSIHEPIVQLEHFAGLLAEGNLQARAPATDVEELSNLTDQVNVMADKLESLIEQNRKEQENLKKAELRTLQAQINPHFLYNTLDTILWQAEAGHSDEVIHITQALSDFFRISLSSGADWIPVSQEIKHLTGYLAIQKIRYRDILNYQIDVPDDMGGDFILKLLLQTLVENALYHGIKFKRGGGTITVSGRREDDRLCFCVSDTGHGMNPEQLASVLRAMRDDSGVARSQALPDGSGSGFGLHNVDQRIRLYYNQEEGLHIESGAGGTTVSFRVPAKVKGDEL